MRYAIYIPNSTSSTSASRQTASVPANEGRTYVNPVPLEILTPAVVEEVKTRACFVEPDMPDDGLARRQDETGRYTINSEDYVSSASSEADREAYSSLRHSRLKRKYAGDAETPSEATMLTLRLAGGTLSIPGWLRHACTDIFFDSVGDVDEPSIPELVLDCLLKVSGRYTMQMLNSLLKYSSSPLQLAIDLRKVFISNILVVGGGSMLPGFPLRLAESIRTLLHRDKRYTSLRGLSRSICIVNCANPSTSSAGESGTSEGNSEEETAATFAWERSLLAWVGASLVGAMKASGKEEWTRDAWENALSSGSGAIDSGDWTRKGW